MAVQFSGGPTPSAVGAQHHSRALLEGGFPEVQGLDARSRRSLLLSYVDSTVLRDVMERHNIRNPLALQWLVRQLLAHAGGAFSVNKLHQAMRSQGLAISREHLTELVQHLEQAFLITSLAAGGGSLRRTQSLPRKIYPIDPGLIPLYDRSGRANLGHALETVVLMELRRRGAELSYLRSESGREVDALALLPDGQKLLVQVCASLHDADTSEREVSSLLELADTPAGRFAEPVLISLDARPPDLGEPPLTGYWMTRPDHDLSLLKGDTSSWPMDLSAGAEPPGPAAAEPRLRQEGFHTHPQRLQIILHASRSSPGPAAAFKAVGGLARGVNVLLHTNVLCGLSRVATACIQPAW